MAKLTGLLLGPPHFECERKPIEIGRRKGMALLAYLAMARQRHHRDELATLLWPASSQSRARGNLRHVLSELNQALDLSWLELEGETVSLNQAVEFWLDVDQFRRQLDACQTHGHSTDDVCPACLPPLTEAVSLYRNDFLAGFTLRNSPEFDEWQFFQVESLRQELAAALERLVRGHSAQEQFEPAIEHARRWLALDPLHEPVQRQLMQLYAQTGQRAAALRQYAACERLLEEELGVLPEEETVRLYEAIKAKRVLPAPTGKVTPSRRKPASQPPKAKVASQSDRFRFERKLGEGGMGEVWLATDTVLDRQVALKRPGISPSAGGAGRLLQEARLLASLNHPNITAIYDFFIDQGESNFYLVMEYVEGKDLSEIIRTDTQLPLDIILEVTSGMLQALSYAHQQGVVHRDVKPANVMIGYDVKLTDFGLANLRSMLQRGTGFMAGTPAYMAPEQIEGRPTDGRADLYSLGVLLFELMSGGQLPFDHADEDEMMAAHLHTSPPPLSQFVPDIPPALEQIILRLLAKDPEERYPSAEAVLDVLEAIHVGPKLGNLPVQLTPFVGREAELAELKNSLQDPACRLLTLVGPGGSGKTRLALEAAAAQIDNYAQGVFFVSLAPLDSVESIVPTVAEILGFRFYEEGEPQQQLLDYLRQKSMLLIMDNFEQLVEGASLVTEILQIAAEVKILATSRVRLSVQGEHPFSVDGMSFPDREIDEDATRYSAVRLFLSSVRRVKPKYEPSAGDLTDIARICRLVEGMPLAILLAANWMEMLTPAEIIAEVGQSLDFLDTDLRDLPARQRSLRAVFDHSWRLLTEREREGFQRLSVFRGGFARQAAQQVANISLRELMALINKSLVHHMAKGRYEIHELLRQYAAEKLDQVPAASEATRDQHCAYFTAALQRWGEDLKGPRQQAALAEIEAEIENVRVAWNWAVTQGHVDWLKQALDGLYLFYQWQGRIQEGEATCQVVVNKLTSAEESAEKASDNEKWLLAKTLMWQGVFSRRLGSPELSGQLLQKSLAILDSIASEEQDTRPEQAATLLHMGLAAVRVSDYKSARQAYEQSLTSYQELGDQRGLAEVLFHMGWLAFYFSGYDEAKQRFEASLAIRKALDDQRSIADSLGGLGICALFLGQLDEGERLLQERLTIHQAIGDQAEIAHALCLFGLVFVLSGKFSEVHSPTEEGLAIFNDLGMRFWAAAYIHRVSEAYLHLGRYDQARQRLQLKLTLTHEVGEKRGIGVALSRLGWVALAEEKYAEAQQLLQESNAIFRAIGRREDLAETLAVLGEVVLILGNQAEARQYLAEALRIAAEIRSFVCNLIVLSGTALLLVSQGKKEWAVELYALASSYPVVANSRWFEDVAGRHIAAVAATLPPEVVAAAQKRGQARDLWATAEELVDEIEGWD